MSKQLGKGLEELFVDNSYLKDIDSQEQTNEILLSKLVPNPYQPRKHFDEEQLNELADSIKEHGVFNPIIVTFNGFKYVIVAGERRYRASKIAGMTTIPAIVREYSEKSMMEIALLENIQRQDLTIIEVAQSYKKIIDKLGLTQEEFAKRVGKSRSQVTNLLGLLNLPSEIIEMVNQQQISTGHARILSKIKSEKKIISLANKVISKKLSVRELEELTRAEEKSVKINREEPKNYKKYEKTLSSKYSNVKIKANQIVFKFSNEDELGDIINRMMK